MTLLDDMARAIFAEDCPGAKWDVQELETHDLFRCEAKAALAVVLSSLRAPSEGMKDAGSNAIIEALAPTPARAAWDAMIEQWAKEQE